MSAQEVFRLPDLGEGLTESEVVEWRVAVGDVVTLNQVIAEVETAKAMVELPSPVAGRITALHAEEGDVVQVGEPLVTFTTGDDDGTDDDGVAPVEQPAAGATGADPASAATPSGRSSDLAAPSAASAERAATGRSSAGAASDGAAPNGSSSSSANGTSSSDGAQPNLVGYGARPARAGRATRRPRRPVEMPPDPFGRHRAPAAGRASEGAGRAGAGEMREPVRGVRRHTAAAMVASATIPQATVHLTCDVTDVLDLLDRLRAHPRAAGTRLTVLTLVARAVCGLAPQHPALLTRWVESDDGPELVRTGHVDLGIAVATDRGLVVPHVVEADTLSLVGLGRALADLTATARAGRSTPQSLRPGHLTLTNVGVFGVDAGTPLLNPGETAILGIGQTVRRPWEHDGDVALRRVMTLSLTFDHRVVDGEQGALFLRDLGALLGDPGLALLLGGTDDPPPAPPSPRFDVASPAAVTR
ncbi:pyruvate dehydrogenase E2 component (dihydrolipoamide acetyltransferase) [Isoptericola jiangsuensis]|uniref:Dihydrolipoamide acetyltransferase component of pyruvate dehydrogenase complex n=1 Tax=Isoptericola jiangsuensis TaxID=548579 RepID=A0A2A9ETH9_9MICO|nr:dihydrolipoamide acetyltransferase family protein [Isoptericola jiangsuensis]PFG42053.1 pyruvate dehydrogenase E2 component (dihydrolipoamide acetyltransferase) [Isoptericola jiangsuensis]